MVDTLVVVRVGWRGICFVETLADGDHLLVVEVEVEVVWRCEVRGRETLDAVDEEQKSRFMKLTLTL